MGFRARQVGVVLAGVWLAAFVARLVFGDLLGLDGWALGAPLLTFALFGLGGGIIEARDLKPMARAEQRNAVLGWGFALSLVPVTACLYLEMPWGVVASVGTAWRVRCSSAQRPGPLQPRVKHPRSGDSGCWSEGLP